MIGKSKRFAIFTRDEFTCQYCGRRPPEVILELDHIHPSSKGGDDDEINLITACFDCNRGKGARKLSDVHPRPDANLKYLKAQQEIMEAKQYLESKNALDAIRGQVIEKLEKIWAEQFDSSYEPTAVQWHQWLSIFSPDEIEFALMRTSARFNAGRFGFVGNSYSVSSAIRYASGVMHRRRQQAEDSAVVQ